MSNNKIDMKEFINRINKFKNKSFLKKRIKVIVGNFEKLEKKYPKCFSIEFGESMLMLKYKGEVDYICAINSKNWELILSDKNWPSCLKCCQSIQRMTTNYKKDKKREKWSKDKEIIEFDKLTNSMIAVAECHCENSYTIESLLKQSRKIWGDEKLSLGKIIIRMGKVFGDLCRWERSAPKGKTKHTDAELKKKLGNIIFSTIRWCDDLGYDPEECIQLAKKSQEDFKK